MADKKEQPGFLSRMYNSVKRIFFGPPPEKTPVPGFGRRLSNIVRYHFKGLVGTLVPLFALTWQFESFNNAKKVELMWMWMFWFFLFRPVDVPVTGLIPVFFLPMTGVLATARTANSYMHEQIQFLFLGGMLLLLLNNSGADRRIALAILNAGDGPEQFSTNRLIYKGSFAAFILSLFSNRLIVTSMITEYVTQTMINAANSKYGKLKSEADLKKVRYVVNNAIQTSAAIGSGCLLNAAYTPIAFKSIFSESLGPGSEYPDVFNYLQYSAFAIPVSLVMFVLNMAYHMILVKQAASKSEITPVTRTFIRQQFAAKKAQLPKSMTKHEMFTHIFLVITLILHFARWNEWFGGWAGAFRDKVLNTPIQPICRVKDATASAIVVFVAHSLPYNWHFLKYLGATKRKDLPPRKPESTVLWFKFVDKNINYGYLFLIGAGNALIVAAKSSGLCSIVSENSGAYITKQPWILGIFLVVLAGIVLCNIISSASACIMLWPFVICMSTLAPAPWPTHVYLAGLGIAMASNLGICYPFLYTPAYFCHYVGKVPVGKMIKYSIGSLIICLLVIWLSIIFFAPILWATGLVPAVSTTTELPPPSGDAEPDESQP